MTKFLEKTMVKRHQLVLNRDAVMDVLDCINQDITDYEMVIQNLAVGNCGWADKSKYYIHVTTTQHRWNRIKDILCEICYEIDGSETQNS